MKKRLQLHNQEYRYLALRELGDAWQLDIKALPYSLLILLENIARHKHDCRQAFQTWQRNKSAPAEVFFQPTRVLMQDFTGVPAIADLAAMRAKLAETGEAAKVNPLSPVDLVIDHSVSVDHFGSNDAFERNMALEFKRNDERYKFLKWAQASFANLRVVPPGTGICHQVNLEYLAQVVWHDQSNLLFPDTVVGTDSHTTMINALGVLGWGVGGIEAEAAMLQQPISMMLPDVCGVELRGKLPEGATATDLVLKIVNVLRAHGVVGKFVEFFGDGLDELTLAERATIANMSPEYGATCGFFPVDDETLAYLKLTGRSAEQLETVEAYCKAQCLWRGDHQPEFTDTLTVDLTTIAPAIAGPKRPQDMITLRSVPQAFAKSFPSQAPSTPAPSQQQPAISNGAVVICAITSCTNTSNPNVMISAGLLAQKAVAKGLTTKRWVKTSLAPGSQVVSSYLEESGLQTALDKLGFQNVGHGCTTCIGNSGALADEISKAITADDLVVCSVLSGNRNFEGRINQEVRANFLASPPLVVAYALAGRIDIDLTSEPLSTDNQGNAVYLRDLWPHKEEVASIIKACVKPQMFKARYADVFRGPDAWQRIQTTNNELYDWQDNSTYIRKPPFFELAAPKTSKALAINAARLLLKLGDSITTDHISPAGAIKSNSPAGDYLRSCNVPVAEFNSYGARRGNHEVMIRGTFANIRIKNLLLDNVEGGFTRFLPTGEQMSVYEAAKRYQAEQIPLLVLAGKNYGSGSSRDWAAKGTLLLGVKAVICESIERIHRSNLIGMGVLPLEDHTGALAKCQGDELFNLQADELTPNCEVACTYTNADNRTTTVMLRSRIDTDNELAYFLRGGILPHVAQSMREV
ncbi:MAG: aconitate hydratase AcnA [Pseudomonadota bacterium]|nr:aconitate hydratase AcnA [Pseudomonadota bacterium]